MNYTVGEISKKFHISVHTLRYYAKEGLMPFVSKNENGVRIFTENDFESIYLIECLKKTGMSLKEIKEFMGWCMEGDSTISKRLKMFETQEAKVLHEIDELQKTLTLIRFKRWYYEMAEKYGTCSVHKNITIDDLPPEIRALKESTKKLIAEAQEE